MTDGHADLLADALAKVAAGEQPPEYAGRIFEAALRRAVEADRRRRAWTEPAIGSGFEEVIGAYIARLRSEAGWTQQALADAMSVFGWSSGIVAQVERGARRVLLEELVVLAGLFAVPVVEFVLPDDDQPLELYLGGPDDTTRIIDPTTVRELILGREGRVGHGGLGWRAALEALGSEAGARPATALWIKRMTEEGT